MALGTFLDVEGAFDNVAFGSSSIVKALNQKCESVPVNNWLLSLIRNGTMPLLQWSLKDARKR